MKKLLLIVLAFFSNGSTAQSIAQNALLVGKYSSDVIGIEEAYLSPKFWQNQLSDSEGVLMDSKKIEHYNRLSFNLLPSMVELSESETVVSRQVLSNRIVAISHPARGERYYADGRVLKSEDYQDYQQAVNLQSIKTSTQARFGLVVRRTDMRTYPTRDKIYKSGGNTDLDRFQETGLFPGQVLVVLHESLDGEWYFAQSYNYAAWVPKADVALGERETILAYRDEENFLVVTGDKVRTAFNPNLPVISELQLDMGVKLPLVPSEEISRALYGQNPYASYVVKLPVRDSKGRLKFSHALVARSKDVSRGYLPFTRENLIGQAFKFLGERYGWGHSYNSRDCTGFVSEIYKTFGILMPRNSGQQGISGIGVNTRFEDGTIEAKYSALDDIAVGDLIYIPGHVMMYLGSIEGKPYVIHDVNGLSYRDKRGHFYTGTLNGVSVTPLLPLHLTEEMSYLDKVYNIKHVGLKNL